MFYKLLLFYYSATVPVVLYSVYEHYYLSKKGMEEVEMTEL